MYDFEHISSGSLHPTDDTSTKNSQSFAIPVTVMTAAIHFRCYKF